MKINFEEVSHCRVEDTETLYSNHLAEEERKEEEKKGRRLTLESKIYEACRSTNETPQIQDFESKSRRSATRL